MKQICSVFFDLDDTLLDSAGSQEAVLQVCQQISEQALGLDPDQLLKAHGEVWPKYWAVEQEKWQLGKIETASVAHDVWGRALLLCGCDSESITASAVQILLQEDRKRYRLFADVVDTLELIRKAGLQMALITNGASELQRTK